MHNMINETPSGQKKKCSTWINGSYAPTGAGGGSESPAATAIRVKL